MPEGSDGFYSDGEKLAYPDADRLVDRYLSERGDQRDRVTSRDVLKWADYPVTAHNQTRVYDALRQTCVETERNWAGRTVFQIPENTDQ